MITHQQMIILLKQLQQDYPAAFKRNYLFYSLIKTKGVMDEKKEFIAWVLGFMIFFPLAISLAQWLDIRFADLATNQATSISMLSISLIFMLASPYIIHQMRQSSKSLYQLHRHTPTKLAILIIAQGINLLYFNYSFLQGMLFYFAINFGFIRFYKENLFRQSTSSEQYYILQQIRRVNYWSYKQVKRTQFKLFLTKKSSSEQHTLKEKLTQFQSMHLQLLTVEHKACQSLKHKNVETYMNELMK